MKLKIFILIFFLFLSSCESSNSIREFKCIDNLLYERWFEEHIWISYTRNGMPLKCVGEKDER